MKKVKFFYYGTDETEVFVEEHWAKDILDKVKKAMFSSSSNYPYDPVELIDVVGNSFIINLRNLQCVVISETKEKP